MEQCQSAMLCRVSLQQTFENWPHRFQFSLFEVMVVKAWCTDLLQLLNSCIRHFCHAFLRVSFQVTKPSDSFRVDFSQLSNFSVAPAEIRNSNNFCIRR